MPCKNAIKEYVEGGYYHIYNRGVDKRSIFEDEQDYTVFLKLLKEYLLPPNHPDLKALRALFPTRNCTNCFKDIDLLAYCLIPNHFHLFAKQKTIDGLKTFMKALATNYVMYFNKKYERVGPLFQGIYKAVLVRSDSYLIHITRYIHTNPARFITEKHSLQDYRYSSYPIYLGLKKCDWVKPGDVLSVFGKSRALYKDFINDDLIGKESAGILGELILE